MSFPTESEIRFARHLGWVNYTTGRWSHGDTMIDPIPDVVKEAIPARYALLGYNYIIYELSSAGISHIRYTQTLSHAILSKEYDLASKYQNGNSR